MTTQPEALRLAHLFENYNGYDWDVACSEAAAELRRLHAVNAELLESLMELLEAFDLQFEGYEEQAVQENSRAAIAKAEGKQT